MTSAEWLIPVLDEDGEQPQTGLGAAFLAGRDVILSDRALVVLADCVEALSRVDPEDDTREHVVRLVRRLTHLWGVR